jgi:DNA-binding response OmpR family regulator
VGAPRILAIDDDPLFLRIMSDQLTSAGMTFLGLREATRAVPSAASFNPDLMLLDRHMPILTGTEVIRALRAFPETAHIPVAIVTADMSERELLRAFAAGAIDVLHKPLLPPWQKRVSALLQELAEQRISATVGGPSLLIQRLLSFYRRSHRSGRLRVNPDTPFEGTAVFHDGELISAELGPVSGLPALEEMSTFDSGTWVFEPEDSAPTPRPPGPDLDVTRAAHEILFVDDDPDICQLFQRQLTRAGFKVDVAENGLEACELALSHPYDLILADLNMPQLDGWGMLHRLRADHRTQDVPVIFLSAHDDYRETLKLARAGAFDYMPKTGKADAVIERLRVALAPRGRALEALASGSGDFRLGAVGPQWAIRQLGKLRATGRLKAKDAWGSYTLAFRDGVPVGAKASAADRDTAGMAAVGALLVSRDAFATFEQGTVGGASELAPSAEQLLERIGRSLNEVESRVTDERIRATSAFDVDEELYELFRKIGSDRELMLARAVCEQRVPVEELAERLSVDPSEVRQGLKELLRRRVISFRGDA